MPQQLTTPFPFAVSNSDVTRREWPSTIVTWFEANYKFSRGSDAPHQTMQILLEYIDKLISGAGPLSSTHKAVQNLGTELGKTKAINTVAAKQIPHHKRIVKLMELGLHTLNSHTTIPFDVDPKALLERPGYSALLLGGKLYEAGDYKAAIEYADEAGWECALAWYHRGQSERRLEHFDLAQVDLDNGLKCLHVVPYVCPFCEENARVCDANLLNALLYRAKAVVLRRQKQWDEAVEYFDRAEDAADAANAAGRQDKYIADVLADVYFSYGYYHYDRRSYEKAAALFIKASNAREASGDPWDSPYTRLAITKLCQGYTVEAGRLFAKAKSLCTMTLNNNREASLSLALCALGENIHRSLNGAHMDTKEPMERLDDALKRKPELANGPLRCHCDDANHFLSLELAPDAKRLVEQFIARLELEINRGAPKQNGELRETNLPPEERLHKELVDVFHTEEMTRLLQYKLGERYDAVTTPAGNDNVRIYELIQWAKNHGKLRQLLDAAIAERQNNATLRELGQLLGADGSFMKPM